LHVGDQILAINGHPASQLAPSDVLVMSSGTVGSDMDIRVMTTDSHEPLAKHIQLRELLP
jgi:C-terminal processing protease CtpA/Prc